MVGVAGFEPYTESNCSLNTMTFTCEAATTPHMFPAGSPNASPEFSLECQSPTLKRLIDGSTTALHLVEHATDCRYTRH
jgi:hypothetical protein